MARRWSNSGAPRYLLEDCFCLSGEIPRVSSLGARRALWALLYTFGESVVTPSAIGSRFTF